MKAQACLKVFTDRASGTSTGSQLAYLLNVQQDTHHSLSISIILLNLLPGCHLRLYQTLLSRAQKKNLVRMKFLTRYGDYAGRLYRNKILSETSSEPTIQILTACVNELQ